MKEFISNYIVGLHDAFYQTEATDSEARQVGLVEALMQSAQLANSQKGKLIFIGNGGSAAVASHKALDFWFTGKIRTINFSDSAALTCVSNDFGYENVFAKQIEAFADKNDILFAISSSGNSENIILAAETARNIGCKIITFSGFKATNRLRTMGDLNFYTPISHFNKVETVHSLLCDSILEIVLKQKDTKEKVLVALDRDGTLVHDQGYLGKNSNWQEEIKLYNDAVEAVRALNNVSMVIVTSNQIGVARGYYSKERVEEINRYIDNYLEKQGAHIDAWYFSPYVEKSWAEKNGLKTDSPWVSDSFPETRKPKTGMLKLAAKDFNRNFEKVFVVGDSLDDLEMGLNANGISIFFNNGKNHHLIQRVKSLQTANPGQVFIVNNLFSAAKIVERTA